MSLELIRYAITTKLAGLDIGPVHSWERYAATNTGLLALYSTDGVLGGWYVRRVRTSESSPSLGRHVERIEWEIRGFLGLQDAVATELQFDAQIEAIRAAFRADETLGGVVASTVSDDAAGIQVEDSGPVMFAGVLAHAARLRLITITYI